LGIIVTDQPLSPDRLLALIDASRGECRQS
jgi:hypothetical protein